MLEALRDGLASRLMILAQRLTSEPRWPAATRVPQNTRTLAGVVVTPDTAITVASVWACLRYLSQTVAVLPWHVMREGPKGATIADTHPIDWLIYKRPSDEWSSFQFRETLVHWALRYGNGYAEIERDQMGRPYALWPIHPDRVRVCRYPDSGKMFYEVTNEATGRVDIDPADMFHVRGFGEGPVGVNVIAYAAQSIGWARAIQLFGASFFGNGTNISGVVTLKNTLKPDGLGRLKAEMNQLYRGPTNANKVAYLDGDADFKPVGIDPQKSQLIEIQQHLVEEICRWFGVPPHKAMHLLRSTNNNVEQQGIEVVVDSVSPWVKRFEDEADWKLFGIQNRQNFYTKMNLRALMRGDAASRIAYYDGMVKIGAYSPNKVLELEDENTIGPDGDIHFVQNQNVTLGAVAKGATDPVQPTPSAPAAPAAGDVPQLDGPASDGPADPKKVEPKPAPPKPAALISLAPDLDLIVDARELTRMIETEGSVAANV